MKIILSQPELNRLAAQAGSVVPNKSTLPILSTILINVDEDGVNFSATDLDISIKLKAAAEIQDTGSVAVPAKRFSDIVRKLDSVDVTLELKKDILHITCGRAKFQIPTMEASDFPKLPAPKEDDSFEIDAGAFKGMIARTRYAVSTDLARPSMNGILMEIEADKITMVATDGHRLAFCRKEMEFPVKTDHKLIVPSKALDQLLRLLPEEENIDLGIGENQVFFNISGVSLFTRLIEGPFPSYQQVIPSGNEFKLKILRDALLVATDRVSTLAASLTTRQIKLSLETEKLTLEVANSEIGKAREELMADYDGSDINIGYNAIYLLDVLKNMNVEEIVLKLDRPDNAGIIEPIEQESGEQYFALLMPLKLSD